MNLPRPASDSWGEWLDVLTPAQLRAVHLWRKATPYRAMMSPKTCWYTLFGRRNPAERRWREALSDDYHEQQSRANVTRHKKERAVFATQEAILGASAINQPSLVIGTSQNATAGHCNINTKLSEDEEAA